MLRSNREKPEIPEIFLEYNCVARKKPIRREKTKPRTTTLTSLCFYGRSRFLIFAVIGRDTIKMPEIFQVLRFRRFHCNEKSGFHVRACTDHPWRPKGSQLGREKRRDESFPEDGTNKSAFLMPTLFIY